MPILVVGGHSRNVGKTSVAAGLISTFSHCSWTALKITSHLHADITTQEACIIHEEADPSGSSDTSRFLAAGAARSLWVRIREDKLDAAMQKLLPKIQSEPFVIIESNRILRYIKPDLYVLVLRYDVEDFKDSAYAALSQAHAILAINDRAAPPPWQETVHQALEGIPFFITQDPQKIPKNLIDFVKSRLQI